MNAWFLLAALPELIGVALLVALHFYEVLNLGPACWTGGADEASSESVEAL